MSMIQSSRPAKKAEKPCNIDPNNFHKKSCFTNHLPFLLSVRKILRAFPNTFPTKMKPTKCPARKTIIRQENQKKRRGKKAKRKSEDCCVTFKPEKFCFLRVPELCKLIFLMCIRRPRKYNLQAALWYILAFIAGQ